MTADAVIDRRRLILSACVLAASCTKQHAKESGAKEPDGLAPNASKSVGLDDIPITLTPDLAGQESAFRADLRNGHAILRAFAQANGLAQHMQQPMIAGAEFFGIKPAFEARLNAVYNRPADYAYSPTTVGSLIGNVLYACSETATRNADPRQALHEDYLRLLAHEMAHALHAAAVDGSILRGPRWFTEGFAVMAAGQFAGARLDRAAFETLLAGLNPPDYPAFGAAVRKLAEIESVPALIARARRLDFTTWALSAARL